MRAMSVVVTLLLAVSAPAATPRDELLRLVQEDVGFCLVVQDLRDHATALLESPFIKQFCASPLGAKVLSAPEMQKIAQLRQFLQTHLQTSPSELRNEILGDAVVLAYRPGPPGKQELEEGLFLVRARDAKLLEDLVNRLNAVQRKSGDLRQIDELEHQGNKYFRRSEAKGTNYYYLHGPVLAFSSQERILRQSIELGQTAPGAAEPAIARELRLAGANQPLAALWINPRSFDEALRHKASEAEGIHAVGLQALVRYWKPLEGIAFWVALDKDLQVSFAVRARVQDLPPAAQRFLSVASEPSELWERFGDNAILSVAGRLDLSALVEMLCDFIPEAVRKTVRTEVEGRVGGVLRKEIAKELLPQLGPDWGLSVTAPPAGVKACVPQVLFALRVRPGDSSTALLEALTFFANLAVFTHPADRPGRLSLKTVMHDKVEVRYLVNDEEFPSGFQPAFALKDGYLVIASSPEALRNFAPHAARVKPATGDVPLLRLSLRELHKYIEERREPLALFLAGKEQLPQQDVSQRLENLLEAMQLMDTLEISRSSSPGRVIFTLRLRTLQSLK